MVSNPTEETPLVESSTTTNNSGYNDRLYRRYNSYNDDIEDMTYGRRLALYLSKYKWYNPHAGRNETNDNDNNNNNDKPSLDKAWEYFEHVTLPRHHLPNYNAVDVLRKAEAGEHKSKTKLYSFFNTPEQELGDFGLGVGVYFYTLRILAIIMFIAGIINIPNLIYYNSPTYNSDNKGITLLSRKSSAICTDHTWVACPTCNERDWDRFPSTYDRYAEVYNENENDNGTRTILSFIKINNCKITNEVGVIVFASLIFVYISVYFLVKSTKRIEICLDKISQTTTDYAIKISNPPHDARDPNEWKQFFEQFGKVISITVALDNEELLTALLKRREYVIQLEELQPVGGNNLKVDPQNIPAAVETAMPRTLLQKLMFTNDAKTIATKIAEIDELIINDLSKRKYKVCSVFVIFETESDQQNALKEMSVGGLSIIMNIKRSIPENLRFRNEYVLRVTEPPEPSCVRYKDLDESFILQIQQRIVTFVITFCLILIACLIVYYVRNHYGTFYAAMTISISNSIFPTICKVLTTYESHASEGSRQASEYFKITACLWIVTTILTAFVTPFTDTLNNDSTALIPAMYAVFITELLKTPLIQISDIPGNVYRHILAPRATDQRRMTAYFCGSTYYLSERYTSMINVLFLTFYYAMLYPAGFFWASATLAVHYFVDKFCILRIWTPAPTLGNDIAQLSRLYFFTGALLAFAIMSSYNFASYPYDNACLVNDVVTGEYIGNFTARTADDEIVSFSIEEGEQVYKYCNQDMLRYKPWPLFPAIPASQPVGGEWMSESQSFASVLGWSSVVAIFIVFLIYVHELHISIKKFFFGDFALHTDLSKTKFGDVHDIYGYIPQVKLDKALFPTLLCDVSKINHELIGWEDPSDPSKDSHNAIYDVPGLIHENDLEGVFSIVRQWT